MKQAEFVNGPLVGERIELQMGLRLHVLEEGQGTPLLLLPGLGQSLYTWRSNIALLSQYFRVLAVDLPGSGYSGALPLTEEPLSLCAEALLELLYRKGAENAVCIGASSGALAALALEAARPGTATALILESPGLLDYGRPSLFRRNKLFSRFCSRTLREEDVREILRRAYFDETRISTTLVQQTMQALRQSGAIEQAAHMLFDADEDAILSSLESIECPTLLVWGEQDPWHPRALIEQYQAGMPHAQLHVQRNCGHAPHAEKSKEFNTAVLRFLGIAPE